uniref:Beta/gamma crystallin 'Greek key' domain-containing protein n=1 Tax=viral metagenome TaxID=1070528 RepID=A0A6C0J3H3_9ZZZZ
MSKLTQMSDTENIYGMIGGQKIPILRKIPEMEGGERGRSPGRRGRSPNKTVVHKTVIKKRSPSPGRKGRSPNKTVVHKTVIKKRSPSPGRKGRSPNKTVVHKTVIKGISPSPGRRGRSPTRCGQKGQAAFFEHCNFKGTKICLKPGIYSKEQLEKKGLMNDTLSSVRPNGLFVKLYKNNNIFSKDYITLTTETSCLKNKISESGKNWNDTVTAIQVVRPGEGGCMIL